MTATDLASIVTGLMKRGVIDAADARKIARMIARGEIDDAAMPLPAEAAIALSPYDETEEVKTFIATVLLLGLRERTGSRQDGGLMRLDLNARVKMRDYYRAQFMLAALPSSRLNVRAWHSGQLEQVTSYVRRQAMAGTGAPLTMDRGPAEEEESRQAAYLFWFAWAIAARSMLGNPFTPQAILNRSLMYQGGGWFAWHRYNEMPTQGENFVVYEYRAVDDPRTCDECGRYSGQFFLPGEGPYPGQVCRGGGRCRCERIATYNPDIWSRLTGVPLNAFSQRV